MLKIVKASGIVAVLGCCDEVSARLGKRMDNGEASTLKRQGSGDRTARSREFQGARGTAPGRACTRRSKSAVRTRPEDLSKQSSRDSNLSRESSRGSSCAGDLCNMSDFDSTSMNPTPVPAVDDDKSMRMPDATNEKSGITPSEWQIVDLAQDPRFYVLQAGGLAAFVAASTNGVLDAKHGPHAEFDKLYAGPAEKLATKLVSRVFKYSPAAKAAFEKVTSPLPQPVSQSTVIEHAREILPDYKLAVCTGSARETACSAFNPFGPNECSLEEVACGSGPMNSFLSGDAGAIAIRGSLLLAHNPTACFKITSNVFIAMMNNPFTRSLLEKKYPDGIDYYQLTERQLASLKFDVVNTLVNTVVVLSGSSIIRSKYGKPMTEALGKYVDPSAHMYMNAAYVALYMATIASGFLTAEKGTSKAQLALAALYPTALTMFQLKSTRDTGKYLFHSEEEIHTVTHNLGSLVMLACMFLPMVLQYFTFLLSKVVSKSSRGADVEEITGDDVPTDEQILSEEAAQ